MPSFTPTSAMQFAKSVFAKVLARTEITDATASSLAWMLARTTGEMMSAVSFRIWQVANSFDPSSPNISDADLAERGRQMGVERNGATYASGAVLTVVRGDNTAEQTLGAGATVQQANDVQYQTTIDIVFPATVYSMSGVPVICLQPGAQGNAPVGAINQLANVPDWVTSVVNTLPLTNGEDQESRASYQKRLVLYEQSRAKSQPAAMEFLALSFSASDGSRVRFASAIQPSESNGYGTLQVDDGNGYENIKRAGAAASYTVPPGGQTLINHEGPATGPIPMLFVTRAPGHTGPTVLTLAAGQFESLFERGIIKVPANKTWSLLEGDVVTLPPYEVYLGIIAELQQQVEGSVQDPQSVPGWRAKGCRVAVLPPDKLLVDYLVRVVPQNGITIEAAREAVTSTILAFHAALPPGQTLFVSQLISAIMLNSEQILTVTLYEPGVTPLSPKKDVYCTDRQALRTAVNLISFV